MLDERDARGLGFISGIFADFFRRLEESHDAYVKNHKSWDDIAYSNMQAVFRGEEIGPNGRSYNHNSMKDHSKQAKFLTDYASGSAMAHENRVEAEAKAKKASRRSAAFGLLANMAQSKAEKIADKALPRETRNTMLAEKNAEEIRKARLAKYSGDIARADAIETKGTVMKTPSLEA